MRVKHTRGIKMTRKIVFDREASGWSQALPLGNGRLGAMVFGGVNRERLQMNEDSIWYGGPVDRINPDARPALDQVRTLILQGEPGKAEELLRYAFSATPQSQRPYQPLADCWITMKQAAEVVEYDRSLDLEESICHVRYRTDRTAVEREYFASAAHHVIAMKMEAVEGERLSFDILLTRERFYDGMVLEDGSEIFLTGSLGKGGNDFVAGCKAVVSGGSLCRIGEHLLVRGADSAVVYLAGTSTFYEKDPLESVRDTLRVAAGIPYEELKEVHIADYQNLFGRVSLELPEEEICRHMTTARRLERVRQGQEDPGLAALYFDFGRYLLISSSRKGSLPANLQGIWNEKMMPPWDSKYTININTEMNYWPAESCGLSECMEPVFDLLERMRRSGRDTAERMYGCRGFVAHHNTDIWADTAPQDIYIPATYWVMGGAWMSLFIWRHYEYCKDLEWLQSYYPVLEDAVLFFVDYLVEDKGQYVTCPSVSPENTYVMPDGTRACVCAGPAMDNEILEDLFEAFLAASKELGREDDITAAVRQRKSGLPPIRIGKWGQIMEWRDDYEEAEPGHRHISQLYALYPSCQIEPDTTQELAQAAGRTLERRLAAGGGHTGWSAAWIANLYAHLWKGEEALGMLDHLLSCSTYDNLMDTHPMGEGSVFQMDGNMGGCDAIMQMLVQDNGKRIVLLPACPKCWTRGRLCGIRLKGGACLTICWEEGEVECILEASFPWRRKIVCGEQAVEIMLEAGKTKEVSFCREV